MAPVSLQELITLSLCNRTNQCLIAASLHFQVEKLKCLARSAQDITCYFNEHRKRQMVVALLDSNGLQLLEVIIDGTTLSHSTSKWKSADTPNKHITILYRCYTATILQMLLLPQRDCATFLSNLDDNLCLTSLSLPGTHESLALYGWPISTCQSSDSSVTKQLHDGIRFLDIRLTPKGLPGKERLLAYHGITDERIEFGRVLEECFEFLNGVGKNETIVMSLKQVHGEQDTFIKLLFNKYVDQSPASPDGYLAGGRQRWFLEDRVPKLGEARGKIVMLSRFVIDHSYGFPGGISPPIWTHNKKGTFDYQLRHSLQWVQTQDWYDIGYLSCIPEKLSYIKQLCEDSGTKDETFSLNYCNGCSFPFALPSAVAKGFLDDGTKMQDERSHLMQMFVTQGVNSLTRDYVVDKIYNDAQVEKNSGAIKGLKVTWALDYYNEPKGADDLIQLLVEANF